MLYDAYEIFLETLANRRRIKIVEALMNGPKHVSEIVKRTKFEQSNVSHNLKRLEKCGFVKAKRNGKNRVYSLNNRTIKPLMILIKNHVSKYCKNCLRR